MGNRNQLQWDLPAVDSFELNRSVYGIPRPEFEQMRDELIDLLDLGALVHQPVRTDGRHGFVNLLAASVFDGDEEAALGETDASAAEWCDVEALKAHAIA